MKNQVPWDFRLIALLIGLPAAFFALGAIMWLITGNILSAIAWGLGAFSLFRTAYALWLVHPALALDAKGVSTWRLLKSAGL